MGETWVLHVASVCGFTTGDGKCTSLRYVALDDKNCRSVVLKLATQRYTAQAKAMSSGIIFCGWMFSK